MKGGVAIAKNDKVARNFQGLQMKCRCPTKILPFWGGQAERSSDVVGRHDYRAVARTHFCKGKIPGSKFALQNKEYGL